MPKTDFLDILEIFWLDVSQISFNLLKKAFATWQHPFLSTGTTIYDLIFRECAEIKNLDEKMTYVFRLFGFFSPFLFLLFLSFCGSDWSATGLAFSLKILGKASSKRAMEWCRCRRFCSAFFTEISEHFRVYLIPRSHQSLNMFKSCLVKHGLKLFSL